MADPKGLARLLRQIAALPKAQIDAAGAELRAGSDELASKIKAACHVPEIAATIQASDDTSRSAKAGAGLARKVTAGKVTGEKGHVFNPRWEEFGTAPHSTHKGATRGSAQDKGPHHPGARARPFFWPTVRAFKKRLKSRMVRAANKAAKAAATVQ